MQSFFVIMNEYLQTYYMNVEYSYDGFSLKKILI